MIHSTPPPSHPSRQHYRNREPQPALWRLGRKVAGKASDPILLDTPCTGSTLPHIHRSWRMAFDQRADVVLEVSSDQLSRRSRSHAHLVNRFRKSLTPAECLKTDRNFLSFH